MFLREFSRERKTPLAEWWWTVDRPLLAALFGLLVAGVMMSFAASPAVAVRLGLNEWHFTIRHIIFLVPTIGVLIAGSFLTAQQARRLALAVLIVMSVLMALTLFVGTEVKGSQRWLSIVGFSIQPSEFVKPAFAIIAAWLISEQMREPGLPGHLITFAIMSGIVGVLLLQPDIGQTALVLLTWAGLLFISGISWWLISLLGGISVAGIAAAYFMFPHVARRFDAFLNPETGDNYQVEKALQSLLEGGWFGLGPGEGMAKRALPDAHADFVFSAAAGEFGILFCLGLVALIAFVVVRGMYLAQLQQNLFSRLAVSAVTIQFGMQASINLLVNLNLIPPKGMTLPFVSSGGTSMIAIAFGMGILLGLTRRKPEHTIQSGLPAFRVASGQGVA
ncbi:FtsW/RodA/SpoVE family cell cycle protein [Maritalea sp.]|jgi:cell division protein FtsW|uniref:FtsW/RodA/SpoVE family cell cycle protein n=1 Tax=Maritalea sp. TaxID=2003361 RepID=UPI0039E34047